MKQEVLRKRDYGYDNVKFVLILAVIVGHLLEFCKLSHWKEVYQLIYLFHMPAFVFIGGMFAGKNTARNAFREFITYLVFQIGYIAFSTHVLGITKEYQFTTPYWILWFLMAMAFYHILTPLFDTEKKGVQIAAIVVTVALSLLAGYDNTIGYTMSLSRFLVFQPFYVLGLYFRKAEPQIRAVTDKTTLRKILVGACAVVLVALTWLLVKDPKITKEMLYGSYDYARLGYGAGERAKLLLAGLVWIAFFLFALKPLCDRKIPLISMIGANTLPVFLFHGFVLKLLQKHYAAKIDNYFLLVGVALGIALVFGNPVFGFLLRPHKIDLRAWKTLGRRT